MANTLLSKAVEIGYISELQREKAEKYKRETGTNDEIAIREMKLLSEDEVLDIYVMMYNYKKETEPEFTDDSFAKQFTYKHLSKHGFIPVRKDNTVKIMTAQPADLLYAEDLIRDITGYKGTFNYSLITQSAFVAMLDVLFKENGGTVDTSELEELGD